MNPADAEALNVLVWVQFGQIATALIAIGAAIWAFRKWWLRDEDFPRIAFEVNVNFVGRKDESLVCELVACLDNKGVVPIKFRDMTFVLRGIAESDKLEIGDDSIRNQLNFERVLCRGSFIPKRWKYSFIYPGVATEYNFVIAIPADIAFVRMQGDFVYERGGETHHAAKVLAVPNRGNATNSLAKVDA